MAQIKALGLFYQNQVSKGWEKLGIVQKIDLKVRHHPQNPNLGITCEDQNEIDSLDIQSNAEPYSPFVLL